MSGPQRKAGRAWRVLRARILAERPWCEIRGPRCTGYASTVDHITPVTMGGDELDPANCRPACARCNFSGGALITNQRRAGKIPSAAEAERQRRWAAADKRAREAACTWTRGGSVCAPACNRSPLPPGCQRTTELTF